MAICGDAHAAASSEDRTPRTQADRAERPTANLHNVVCPVSFPSAPTKLARLFEKDQNRLPELVFHIRLLSCGYD
jgi:hypothetical protein